LSRKHRNTRRTPLFEISQIHEQTPVSIERDKPPFIISENVQARQRNLVDFNKIVEDLGEAGEYILFALDKRPALWKIYDKKI